MRTKLPKEIIPFIERALELSLYQSQKDYILDEQFSGFSGERASGRTTAHMIRLALDYDGQPLDISKPEDFADGWELTSRIKYAYSHYRPTFLNIYYTLKNAGLPVRKLIDIDTKEEKTLNNYKVSYWFRGRKGTPDREVFVQTESADRTEIKRLGLAQLDSYPRTYEVRVDKVDTLDQCYVVKINLPTNHNTRAWYSGRNGEMVVVYLNPEGRYVTRHTLDESETYGLIDPGYCTVVASFKVEDDY